ncbi:hypothetical protein LWI29_034774 [Acer saccharum]|uniref:Uncharacterized protein n=1 Tax=Acer saccharum TaxID=4024 RepID=A0AA39SB26_ACESA|nr:hypothetical protein LWI29_034774 [Acer saccharum]
MARLNVWLRVESPPKRFNHRSSPLDRQSWSNQGVRFFNRSEVGSWRPGASRHRLAHSFPANSSGDRSNIVIKGKGQVGDVQCLEPHKHSMRMDAAFNSSGNMALSGGQTVGVNLTAGNGKLQQDAIMKGKNKEGPAIRVGPMKVDQLLGKRGAIEGEEVVYLVAKKVK